MKRHITNAAKNAAIVTPFLAAKQDWTPVDEIAQFLREQSGDSMTLKTARRRVQEARQYSLRADNQDAVIIASDEIAAGRMGFKVAVSPEEIERYSAILEKKRVSLTDSIANLSFHHTRLLRREQAFAF